MLAGFAGRSRFSFWFKALAGGVLVVLADQLFEGHGFGSTLGGFALVWLALTVATRPAIRRDRRALIGVAASALSSMILIDRPGLVGWLLFWGSITVTAVSPRAGRLGDAWTWSGRILAHAVASFAGPVRDFQRLRRRLRPAKKSWRTLLLAAVLPLGGGALFLGLFATANPIIGGALSAIRLPELSPVWIVRAIFWLAVFVAVWATLRPSRRLGAPRAGRRAAARRSTASDLPGPSVASVTAALVVFNALFALENTLDLAFLWSGAGLPSGMTLAQYAHRGAYPLVATALLAGAFSLFILREGSATGSRPLIRGLVGLWVGQNVLLSASSILRTLDYVQAYSLTRLRIAALLWMGLVTVGLALIGWRMLRRKSRAWLINANALALGAVLSIVSVGDLGAIAASWNVRHARDVGGTGAVLDVCYLDTLGASALLPVLELEQRKLSPELRARAANVQLRAMGELKRDQLDWRRWTWRGSRRLDAAEGVLQQVPQLERPARALLCEEALAPAQSRPAAPAPAVAPFAPTASASAPLTTGAQP